MDSEKLEQKAEALRHIFDYSELGYLQDLIPDDDDEMHRELKDIICQARFLIFASLYDL